MNACKGGRVEDAETVVGVKDAAGQYFNSVSEVPDEIAQRRPGSRLGPRNPTMGCEVFRPYPVGFREIHVSSARVKEDARRFAIREALCDIEQEAVVVVGQV
jgi:hypothetical protein